MPRPRTEETRNRGKERAFLFLEARFDAGVDKPYSPANTLSSHRPGSFRKPLDNSETIQLIKRNSSRRCSRKETAISRFGGSWQKWLSHPSSCRIPQASKQPQTRGKMVLRIRSGRFCASPKAHLQFSASGASGSRPLSCLMAFRACATQQLVLRLRTSEVR